MTATIVASIVTGTLWTSLQTSICSRDLYGTLQKQCTPWVHYSYHAEALKLSFMNPFCTLRVTIA